MPSACCSAFRPAGVFSRRSSQASSSSAATSVAAWLRTPRRAAASSSGPSAPARSAALGAVDPGEVDVDVGASYIGSGPEIRKFGGRWGCCSILRMRGIGDLGRLPTLRVQFLENLHRLPALVGSYRCDDVGNVDAVAIRRTSTMLAGCAAKQRTNLNVPEADWARDGGGGFGDQAAILEGRPRAGPASMCCSAAPVVRAAKWPRAASVR